MFLGADGGTEVVPGLNLFSTSVLGIFILLALFGWVWFKPAVDGLKERADKAERQRDELVKVYQDEIIPVLREVSTQVLPTLVDTKLVLTNVRTEMEIRDRQDRR